MPECTLPAIGLPVKVRSIDGAEIVGTVTDHSTKDGKPIIVYFGPYKMVDGQWSQPIMRWAWLDQIIDAKPEAADRTVNTFTRKDGHSGGGHLCEIRGLKWTEHAAPGSKCPLETSTTVKLNLNAAQRKCLEFYANRDFEHLADIESDALFRVALKECGDGLLRFLMDELSSSEDCDSVETAIKRLDNAINDITAVQRNVSLISADAAWERIAKQTTVSAFKPSSPNPAVWTDELIAIRQAEYAAFQKTPKGIAEDKAFDALYSEYETDRANGACSPQTPHG